MAPEQKKRLVWIQLYQQIGNAGVVCRRCGISRPTLCKWLQRYESGGIAALQDQSRRPQHSPARKVSAAHEQLILSLRQERKLGARRIQSELQRLHEISFSLATIHKVLARNDERFLKPKRHYRKQVHRYNCQLPGQRVQMDVCKIANHLYQYTAIDDCTRYPDLFANVARFAIIAFAVIAALNILEIAPTVVGALWIAFLALIVGSVALAFGLGGREAASHLMLGRMLRTEVEPGAEVTAGAYHGKLIAIGSLFTTLETPQGIVKVPNSQLTGQAVQMDQGQYQWQVQKREELKQRATNGMRQQ